MKRWLVGLLGVLPAVSLSLPGVTMEPVSGALAGLAICLDAGAVKLPFFGIFSAAPVLLALLAWKGQTLLLAGAAIFGLAVRTFFYRGGTAACWELGSRFLFCKLLMLTGPGWGVVLAAVACEGYLRLGAIMGLGRANAAQEKVYQRWHRFDRYVQPHRLALYCLTPVAWLVVQTNPLYLFWFAPVLWELHRAVDGEQIRLALRDEEELEEKAKKARQELGFVSGQLSRAETQLQLSQTKQAVFWELSQRLFGCRTRVETAECSLQYLATRLSCQQTAFWQRDGKELRLLAGTAPNPVDQVTRPNAVYLELGNLGLLYCARSAPFQPQDTELLTNLAGVFTLGLQSVTLLEDQKQQLGELLQSSKVAALGQLSAGLAHELNSPLASIKLQLGLLQQRAHQPDKLVAGLPTSLLSLNQSVEQAQVLLRKLLFYSRDGALDHAEVDLLAVVEDTLELMRPILAAQGVNLVSRLQPLEPLRGNASELQQALSNLLVNARDACASGGLVEVYTMMQGQARTILIRDNGRGIEPEILDRIFEPFFTTAGPGEAAGLGLSMAQQILMGHGGKITAANRDSGRGADFLLEL